MLAKTQVLVSVAADSLQSANVFHEPGKAQQISNGLLCLYLLFNLVVSLLVAVVLKHGQSDRELLFLLWVGYGLINNKYALGKQKEKLNK